MFSLIKYLNTIVYYTCVHVGVFVYTYIHVYMLMCLLIFSLFYAFIIFLGDFSSRKSRPEIRTKSLQFSPTGRAWSAVTTEGLLMFTLDNKISFNPFDLSCDVTPESVKEAIKAGSYSQGLVLSLKLNEYPLILEALETVPLNESTYVEYYSVIMYTTYMYCTYTVEPTSLQRTTSL